MCAHVRTCMYISCGRRMSMCACACKCTYVIMCVYVCMYTYICIYNIYIYIYIYIYTHTHIHTYIHTYIHIYIYIYILCMYVCMYVQVYVCQTSAFKYWYVLVWILHVERSWSFLTMGVYVHTCIITRVFFCKQHSQHFDVITAKSCRCISEK